METLLKKKKSAKGREADGELHTAADPPTQEIPAEPPSPEAPREQPSPHEPPPRERPRIKTREAVSTKEGGADAGLSLGERMMQRQIKTRESAVHDDPRPDVQPAPQAGSEPPQVRTRETAVCDVPTDAGASPRVRSEPPKIKTRDACIQGQPTPAPEQPPQALVQGRQEFLRERGRAAAMKRAEGQRMANGKEASSPPAPARRGYADERSSYAPAQAVRRPPSPGEPDTRPVRDGGRTIIKTARSGRKATERTARQTIKTAERSSRKAIKTTQRTAKTAQQTVKTAQRSAQATVKATQRAVQTARATAKAAAATAKATAKATVAAIKAAIAAMQELIAAIAAGGWVVIVVVLVICMIGLLIASPFGIFFSDGGGSPDAASPTAVIAQINSEYADRLSALQAGGTYDRVEIQGGPPSWADVFAVFAAKTAGGAEGAQVSVLDTDTVEKLRAVFWDMTKITTAEADVEHPAVGDTAA